VTKLSSYDPNVDPGVNKGTMKSFDITSDGTVNIDFTHVNGNPLVNAIELVNTSVGPNGTTASLVNFDGTSVTSQSTISTGTFDWSNVRNAVMIGHTLFYGQTDGFLYRRTFDGSTFGDPAQVNPYIDPAWNTVLTGSGPSTQTYTGVLPAWYSQLSSITGMFYANGRIYYTRSGQSSLYWRWFSPDSGIVSGTENTVTGGNITWSSTRGMFIDGNTLYVVSSTNGQLLKIGFANGAPTGTSSVADSTVDWRGRAVFLASVLPNVAPAAAFTPTCSGLSCTFDASAAADSDGTITSYEWTFSDGDQDGGQVALKDFAATGTYDVTLTVTDDGGLSSTVTQQVSVVKPNLPPAASFAPSCDYLDCTFDATGSSDSDGTVTDYAWDFGDGTTGTGSAPEHVYDQPGTYAVTVVVTDDDGATDTTSASQVVVGAPGPSTVSYVGGAVAQANATNPNVTTPTTVVAGDRLLLALTLNSSSAVLSDPAGVTGWTVLDTTTSGNMMTRVYTRVATAADANKKVTVTLSAAAKYTMTVEDYRGVRSGALVSADLAETVVRAGHTTPVVDAPEGSWVVSYWADKSSATTGFGLPGSVTGRHASCGTSTGHICSTLADSAGSVPTGQYGGLTATADSASGGATMWSVILRTQAPNQAPTASFTFSCDSTGCSFDGTGSTDTDGSIASYAWSFGDGGTGTGATPSHDFGTSGTRDVTLTVTDDEGATGTLTQSVSVVRHNAAPTASFTSSCTFLACTFDAGASADSDGTIASYAWDFGDGSTDTTSGATPDHTYGAGGPETVTLTVTDNDGGTDTTTRSLSPAAVRPIALDGSTSVQGNLTTASGTVPAGATAGDQLLMALSVNDATRVIGTPTGVTGWTLVDSATSGTMKTIVFTKTAAAGDPGKTVRVPFDLSAKFTLTVAAYSGDMLAPQVVKASETVSRTTHTTPTVQAHDGDWAVSYWADKSSATTGYTLPNGVTQREALCNTNSGHICSVLADSGGQVSAGTYGALTATADAASGNATMWTILLPRAG
jgi:PKD repeat protein